MTKRRSGLGRCLWLAMRRDLFLGLPFVPLYSAAELLIAFASGSLLQLIFVETPRVPVASLLPEGLRAFVKFGQTLDRKDLAFMVPLVIVLAGLVKLIASFASSALIERAGHRGAHALRENLLKAFLGSRGNTVDSMAVDDLANQMIMDTTLLQSAVSKGTVSVVRDGCALVFLLAGMFVMAFEAMLYALVVIIPLALILRAISRSLTLYAQGGAARQVSLATRVLQSWHGRLTVHALRAGNRERAELRSHAEGLYAYMRRSFFVRTAFRPGTELLAVGLLAGLLWWKFQSPSGASGATVTSLLILGAFAFRPLKQVSGVIALAADVGAVYRRLSRLWSTLEGSAASEGASDRASGGHRANDMALVAKNVSLVAESGRVLLSQCSLAIPFGARVALVGESGAGKTTFLRAAAGLLVPTSGAVEVAPRTLLATQHPYVFKGSVQENILYADDGGVPGPVELDAAKQLLLRLRLAHSATGAQMVAEKNVGFLGEGLSGGEKARVALARLLHRDPQVLLLDEPTANLDARSAEAFWEAVAAWKARDTRNTVVAVSHALHEVKDFDRVYVFQQGSIVREGTPAEVALGFPS